MCKGSGAKFLHISNDELSMDQGRYHKREIRFVVGRADSGT